MIWISFKTIRFFVARQYKESVNVVLKWGAAFYRMAERSIYMNPDPVVQANANGFAMTMDMNQSEESREKAGRVQDYHILPELLTTHRKVAIIKVEKQKEEAEKEKVLTKDNNFLVNLMLKRFEDDE